MRRWIPWTLTLLILAGVSSVTLSWAWGQTAPRPPAPQAPTIEPKRPTLTVAPSKPPPAPAVELDKLTPLQRQMHQSAQRGGGWLARMNETRGRFVPGWQPSLAVPTEGNSLLRQATATVALARSARHFRNDDQAARATQAIVALMQDTEVDTAQPSIRRCSLPTTVVNRLGLAALVVLAVHELPAPNAELLDQAEQLCNFLRGEQLADGSFRLHDEAAPATLDPDAINHHPGLAICALARSQQRRPQPWKLATCRKALPYYAALWKKQKNRDFVRSQSAGFAEVHTVTGDRPSADFVLEMNDWVCGLQHDRIDPHQPRWYGGFMERVNERVIEPAPSAAGAVCCEALTDACRVTRQLGDLARHDRYLACLERGLQYLCTLQYTEADTQHFSAWYRPRLVGGFHASHADGTLRLDDTAHAVCAMLAYLAPPPR